jgi:hypothetical protein
MHESTDLPVARVLRSLGVCTLAVAMICMTFPAPAALAASGREPLLAQAYQTPPAYPPTEPPPPGYQSYPPQTYPAPSYAPPTYQPPSASQSLREASEALDATNDGKADADANISGVLWFVAGFFLSWVGILLGYLVTPSPDGTRLLGKSPAYVQAYTNAYQREGKAFQGLHAIYGCATSGVLEIVAVVVVYALAIEALSGCLF